jgi:predicted acylesterase/phospholipase RssA
MADCPQKQFLIGLAISGAVSAGAYVAAVVDFLVQALDEWEKERTNNAVPNHRVELKLMSGASAGAITAAIGAVSLAREIGRG